MTDVPSESAPSPENLSFEEALQKLEAILEEMEGGTTPLDKLIQKFEEGTQMVQICQKQLGKAELKIESLKKNLGELEFESLDQEAP